MRKRSNLILFYFLIIGGVVLTTHFGSKAITVMAENASVQRKHCIILDAGHGGVDGGTTSCVGKLESAYNLEISMRLNDLFHMLGYETKMIRQSDISIYTKGETIAQKKISDLKERVRIVNETDNGLLLSIHQNHFSDQRYHGAQVFYAASEGSRQLANQMQDAFKYTINPGSNRMSAKCDGIYLMEHIDKTGVLIECGFLSNPEEEAKLNSASYQKQVCSVIAATVSSFLSNT